MVVVKLMGGLGNQLFQYSAGFALAQRLGVRLLLDTSFLENKATETVYTKRNYELGHLSVKADLVTPKEVSKLFRVERNKLFRKLSMRFPSLLHNAVYNERGHIFNDTFLELKDPVYLNGFWQSEKYFRNIREELVTTHFNPVEKISERNKALLDQINSCNSVSVHVRRTDYVTDAKTNSFHGLCTPFYYLKACSFIADRTESPHFFMFSDDPEWVKDNLKLKFPATYISHNKGSGSFWDMYLMQFCKHNIIANSSFSWWGAWLNNFEKKIVVAPQKWFNDPEANKNDIVPSSWIRL